MKLSFAYDLNKDVENLLKSFKSVNSSRRSALEEEYLAYGGDMYEASAKTFLLSKHIDAESALHIVETSWRPIEDMAIERMEKMFACTIGLPKVYLSSNSRCTYSTSGNYFFVNMFGKETNRTIIHELLHFYTWHAFHQELEAKGISKERYNDIKESLTELINTDFQDLLLGQVDHGYPQHSEMRARMKKLREEGKTLPEIVNLTIWH